MKDGFSGKGYAVGCGRLVEESVILGFDDWLDACADACSPAGGRRTTGFPASIITPAWRGNDATAGETMPSADNSRASDDLRLMATLGE